ncbi:SUMF1/EgtB/PvdO family nonheme iron enzyme [Hyphomonas sp.]|uniref:SUMF1/EgtB/PvdO family nonheme iron enzyme n=1 Tax=Hyphomonas sp. TaxID=87 RepID=UPI0025C47B6E|nr:SUMF1/EgtB/PvdO family nonheme iron enzyme [Hyphomonas sp.]
MNSGTEITEDRVFISYRRRKLPQIAAMKRRLEALSVKCWYDLGLDAGDDWRRTVNEKLESVPAGVIAFTPDVFDETSPWVLYEAEFLRDRKVAVPTLFEQCKLQPPFARDHARNLEQWFQPYSGAAHLPHEGRAWTSGPANSIEWQSVLKALESLLGRSNLTGLDEIIYRTGLACFGGDLELAIEHGFDLDLRTSLQPNLDDLVRLQIILSDWLAAASESEPARSRVRFIEAGVSRLVRTHSGANAQFWADGVRKGLNAAASKIPGSEFRDLETSPAMRVLAGRSFRIGSPDHEVGRSSDEGPQKEIQLKHQFAIAVTPTTVAQWRDFVDETGLSDPAAIVSWNHEARSWRLTQGASWRAPGFEQGDTHPVVGVSWDHAKLYCQWLTDMTGQTYRLPTEAEWEFAARAGSDGPLPDGVEVAGASARAGTAACITLHKSSFGLIGMIGNVWEWCEDSWVRGYSDLASSGEPRVRAGQPLRVARGGGWRSPELDLRCAARKGFYHAEGHSHVGFRVVRHVVAS